MLPGSREARYPMRLFACGGCAVGLFWGLGLILAGLSKPVGLVGQARQCRSNLYRLGNAVLLYAHDYDERLPPTVRWMDASKPYWKAVEFTRCPAVPGDGNGYGYAMNARLDKRTIASIAQPDATPLLFDSLDLSRNADDPFKSLPSPGRHTWREKRGTPLVSGNLVAYVSGRVRFVADKQAEGKER
jgi:hypothetical protein